MTTDLRLGFAGFYIEALFMENYFLHSYLVCSLNHSIRAELVQVSKDMIPCHTSVLVHLWHPVMVEILQKNSDTYVFQTTHLYLNPLA